MATAWRKDPETSVYSVCRRHWPILMRLLFGEAIKRRISLKAITIGVITSTTD